ncbi:NAD(P)H-dependent oxidoreductase [Thalassobacillus sp. C254]|nr:NAD(P)H-dependent oxidoreductase [Thalassobacillus sp. C254]
MIKIDWQTGKPADWKVFAVRIQIMNQVDKIERTERMGKQLILFMHPDKDSFNGAILQKVKETFQSSGEEVMVRDIHQLALSPVLSRKEYKDSLQGIYPREVKEEHRYMEWADKITIIFPLWWGTFPAAGKGYLDRILSYGFAYELDGEDPIGKMKGKEVGVIYTTGSPKEEYEGSGMADSVNKIMEEAIFSFCGFTPLPPLHFGNVVLASEEEHEEMLSQAKEYIKKYYLN